MQLVDTHCHIHEASAQAGGDEFVRDKWAKAGFTDPEQMITEAERAGVSTLICVGCTLRDSEMAVKLAQNQSNCWASVGVHPHEAKDHIHSPDKLRKIRNLAGEKGVVAIGEIGLDYYYTHSPKDDQIALLHFQLELALNLKLPIILHIRDAFDDFWPIFDQYKGLQGVVHSFSADIADLKQILSRGLYVGLNGIMTFTKDENQLDAAKAVPLESLLLETDAPFLTPTPYRGTICEPKHVVETAKFLSGLRNEPLETMAQATTANAKILFKFQEK